VPPDPTARASSVTFTSRRPLAVLRWPPRSGFSEGVYVVPRFELPAQPSPRGISLTSVGGIRVAEACRSPRTVPIPGRARIAPPPGGSTREGYAATPLDTPSGVARAHLPGLGETRRRSTPLRAPFRVRGSGAPSGGGSDDLHAGSRAGRETCDEASGDGVDATLVSLKRLLDAPPEPLGTKSTHFGCT